VARYKPGRIAKSILRNVGDVDVSRIGSERRIEVVDRMSDLEIMQVTAAGVRSVRRPVRRIAALERRIGDRARRRERKNALRRDRVEQGRLWRSVGVYEKTPHYALPFLGRVFVLVVLAALDFYIFAQAYAVVEDISEFDLLWWLGGILGLVVFLMSIVLANALKTLLTERAQRRIIAEATQPLPDGLVVLEASREALQGAGAVFAVLLIAGVWIRIAGSAEDVSVATVLFQGLIPLVAVVVELYLHDPMERKAIEPNVIDRWLGKRLAAQERRKANVEEETDLARGQVRQMYEIERSMLDIEQQDLGIRPTES
jgi:hypothetical protein